MPHSVAWTLRDQVDIHGSIPHYGVFIWVRPIHGIPGSSRAHQPPLQFVDHKFELESQVL